MARWIGPGTFGRDAHPVLSNHPSRMAPNIVVLLNMAGLFLLDFFFLADINITQDMPDNMAPGTEVRVTVNVNKGSLGGFAKLQFDLPPGLTATAIETKGASFTFSDNKAKFIWMALPSSPTFRISYTLSADPHARGPLTIQGRLSYIENNERKTYDTPTRTIDLGNAPVFHAASETAATTPAPPPAHAEQAHDLVSAGAAAPVVAPVPGPPAAALWSALQGPGNVGGVRKVTAITEKEMLVEVEVNKGSIRGFGKLQETIPAGFTAMEKTSDEAIFTVQDRFVKFVWLNLPARDKIKVVYKLRANGQPEGEYTINGEFGYLLNDETQRAVLGGTSFLIGPKALDPLMAQGTEPTPGTPVTAPPVTPPAQPEDRSAETAAAQQKAEAERKAREAAATAQQKAEADAKAEADRIAKEEAQRIAEARRKAEQEAQARAQEQATQAANTPPSGKVPAPETGITYKVQITAAHTQVGRNYFRDRHKFTGDFGIENHDGWVKYVTGRFTEYKQARDKREALVLAGHDFPGPFVTAYNNGERITVQEALMVSSQRWLP